MRDITLSLQEETKQKNTALRRTVKGGPTVCFSQTRILLKVRSDVGVERSSDVLGNSRGN